MSVSLAAILDFGRHLGKSETVNRAPRLKSTDRSKRGSMPNLVLLSAM